ncbi:SNF2-related protein [Cupriavidus pauculus]|uniref:SNF2-related protein n=1 Tax=Cupriavidus pauculus TaxID=82633 RepID=UPI001EE1B924|nr:SNF2-related protein [Cupriavidus pauculus]GJG98538.1 DEAD/DEAH box helicase [Cupriavidus pauculus]
MTELKATTVARKDAASERAKAIRWIRAQVAKYGLTLEELESAARVAPPTGTSPQLVGKLRQDRETDRTSKAVRSAVRQSFGRTWWGEQWLNALTELDYDNRLPRGRTYANKGAVKDLVVTGGTIQAQVQGSRPRPYHVTIKVPPLSSLDSTRLLDAVAAEPTLIARMLNRELDPSVLDHARKLGISIFPTRWKDLEMQCSCPDWAVPCKHLAAAIYLLSREIDGNPFLVFALRGIDLAQALTSRDIHLAPPAGTVLPTLAESLSTTSDALVDPGDLAALAELDFSEIADLSGPLLQLLPARPTFFPNGDFRETLQRALKRVSTAARQMMVAGASVVEAQRFVFSSDDRPTIALDARLQPTVVGAEEVNSIEALEAALARVEASTLPEMQHEVAAMYQVRLMALQLLARGAVVPQILSDEAGAVSVRWIPTKLDGAVTSVLQHLTASLPSGLVRVGTGRKRTVLARESQAVFLCSIFLDHFIHAWSNGASEKPHGDKTLALFFRTGQARYDGPGEGEIAAGIHTWLSRYHLAQQDYAPVLCLEEVKGGRFGLTLAIEQRPTAPREPVPLAVILTDGSWSKARFGILQTVSLLAEFYSPLLAYVRAGAHAPIRITVSELPALLFDALPAIRLLGIRALLPKALDRLLRPRLSMQIEGKSTDTAGYFDADDVFAFDWKVAIGDHLLTRAEFEALVKDASGLVRFKGSYVYLESEEIERLRAQLVKPSVPSGAELLHVALAGEFAGTPVGLDARARAILQDLVKADTVPLPRRINATLRPYQQRGYAWLYRNARVGLGSVIADDMGLGKTLQVIATLQKLKEDGALEDAKVLVIMPTSLLTNWQKEIERFAPELTVGVFHGSKRELTILRPDVLLTTYGISRTAAASLQALTWRIIVVDEAQNIKNPAAAQTKAVKAFNAGSFIAMSGTPVENRLSEYWSILDFANRGYLGNLRQFVQEYATPIQFQHDQHVVQRFKRVTAPFMMRRLKSDKAIIGDLPDKIEQDQYCSLTKAQSALYQSVVQEGLRTISGEADSFRRQGLVLQLMLALKQICNHPAQYLKGGDIDPIASGKAMRFLELVDDIHASHEKVLVFTQFREMGNLLCAWLRQRYGREPLFLHGGVARTRRDAMVERFQNDRTERVLVLSLKAGGTGLNLTAASNVIHYDLWWNPAVEAQATDRAYRIGQQRNVQVHRFLCRATFEERINDMIRFKRELADLTVGTGEQWIGNLSAAELESLFALGERQKESP